MSDLIAQIRAENPLLHCITNYVSANDCANIALALGASPIMADAPEETAEITANARAVVHNLGGHNPRKHQAMLASGRCAQQKTVPTVLDPVGCGASAFRKNSVRELLEQVSYRVIRCNSAEALSLLGDTGFVGIDSRSSSSLPTRIRIASALSRQTGAVVAITGAEDVVACARSGRTGVISNGNPMLGRITGSGCMCSALVGSFLAVTSDLFEASVSALSLMGVAGELAFEQSGHLGTMSFRTALIDQISLMDDRVRKERSRIELL